MDLRVSLRRLHGRWGPWVSCCCLQAGCPCLVGGRAVALCWWPVCGQTGAAGTPEHGGSFPRLSLHWGFSLSVSSLQSWQMTPRGNDSECPPAGPGARTVCAVDLTPGSWAGLVWALVPACGRVAGVSVLHLALTGSSSLGSARWTATRSSWHAFGSFRSGRPRRRRR